MKWLGPTGMASEAEGDRLAALEVRPAQAPPAKKHPDRLERLLIKPSDLPVCR